MFARHHNSDRAKPVTGADHVAARIRWYLRALGFHPLVRTLDRLEALAVLAVLGVALIAVPVAMSAGSLVHDAGLRKAEEQNRTRHSVQAVVVAGVGLPTDLNTPAYVRAQWREGSRERTESVVSHATVKPGDQVTVWLDDTNRVVSAPLRADDAGLQAAVAAVTVWTCLVLCGALVAMLVRRAVDRARDRAWDRELRLLLSNDDGRANRQN